MSNGSFKGWGPIASVVLGFLTYKIPESFIILIAPFLLPLFPSSENIRIFLLQGLFEALAIGVLLLVLRWYRRQVRDIGWGHFKPGYALDALLGFCSYFVIAGIAMQLISQFYHIPNDPQAIGFVNPSGGELVLVFIALVCIVPVAEELLFRGFIYTGLRSAFSFPVTAAVVSLLFALAHGQLNVGLDVFFLSLILCYLRERTDSLWPGILLHACKNSVAFFFLFIYNIQ